MNKNYKKVVSALMAITMIASMPMAAPTVSAASDSSVTYDYQVYDTQLNVTSLSLTKGYKSSIKLMNPKGSVRYWSADTSVATVSNKGSVTGKGVGSTYVYASDGTQTYTCYVRVTATKITLGSSKCTLDKNARKKVKITVKGEKYLRADVADKDVATVEWGKNWNSDTNYLYITGNSSGTTTIKVYNPNYPDVYRLISVTVNGSTTLYTDSTSVSCNAGSETAFRVYGDANKVSVGSSNTAVVTATDVKRNGYFDINVRGIAPGNANIIVYDANNNSNRCVISVNVDGDVLVNPSARYYVERIYDFTKPSAVSIAVRNPNDRIAYWADEATSQLIYMIVPYNYVPKPGEYCIPVSSTVNTTPFYNGDDYYWYLINGKDGYYATRYLDIAHPSSNPIKVGRNEKLVWSISKNGAIEYMIIPDVPNTDFSKYKYVLNYDGSTYYALVDYYRPTDIVPRKKIGSDLILSWYDYNGAFMYMLVPYNYDTVKADTAIVRETGIYQYYTVYSSKPRKLKSTDIIIDYWNDKADSTRYILVPNNYSEDKVDEIVEKDIGSSISVSTAGFADAVIKGVNSERTRVGLSQLSYDSALSNAANVRASELESKFGHKRPDGTIYKTALDAAGVQYNAAYEIILDEVKYPSDAVNTLIKDSDYRDIILSSRNKKIAVTYNSKKDAYLVLITD